MHRARLHIPVAVLELGQPSHRLAIPALTAHVLGETLQPGGLGEDVRGRGVQQLGNTAMDREPPVTGAAPQRPLAHLALVAVIDA